MSDSYVIAPVTLSPKELLSASKEELNNDLIRAAKNGQTEKVLALIKTGADVNAKNMDGDTALMYAAWDGHRYVLS